MNNKYNNETLAAFQEAADMKKQPENYKTYNTVDEMFEISKDFKEIDYLKENFERNEVKS